MKTCTTCKLSKDVSEFYEKGGGKRRSQCKDCTTERDRAWREKNRERRLIQKAEERMKNAEAYKLRATLRRKIEDAPEADLVKGFWSMMLAHYGPKCMKCGSEENLTHDHIIPVTWEGSSHTFYNSQILCASCNSAKLNRNCIDYRDWSKGILIGPGRVMMEEIG